MVSEPSVYENEQWKRLHEGRAARPGSRAAQSASDGLANAARRAQGGAERIGNAIPAFGRARNAVARAGSAVGQQVPRQVVSNAAGPGRAVTEASARALARLTNATLRPSRIVRAHKRHGHPVSSLLDIRRLDLELVDAVKPSALDVAYASVGAAVGAGTGVLITGGEAITATGAASAPGLGTVAGAFAADTAAMLSLCSRLVAHTAMHYGYDPNRPDEKLFVLAVVNFGTASTTASKLAAFGDVSRLTQSLYRGATWAKLNQSRLEPASHGPPLQLGEAQAGYCVTPWRGGPGWGLRRQRWPTSQ